MALRFRRTNGLRALALLAVAGIVGAACGGAAKTSGAPIRAFGPEHGVADAGGSVVAGPVAGPTPAVIGGQFQIPVPGPRIVKTASVTLDIKDQSFEQQALEATLIASRYGGFVASSRSAGGKHESGTLVLRIPAAQFEIALGALRALGKVRAQQISGEDVTAQFVDLQARLRNWEAQESVLLRLMRQSSSIEESLKVQRALQDVQLAIEELRGQLRVLTDQTDMSTITLSMIEKAAAPVAEKANPFVRSWRAAVHGTVAVFTGIVIGIGYLSPILAVALLAGLGWVIYRRIRPRAVAVR